MLLVLIKNDSALNIIENIRTQLHKELEARRSDAGYDHQNGCERTYVHTNQRRTLESRSHQSFNAKCR